jgi:hypothetical protein
LRGGINRRSLLGIAYRGGLSLYPHPQCDNLIVNQSFLQHHITVMTLQDGGQFARGLIEDEERDKLGSRTGLIEADTAVDL